MLFHGSRIGKQRKKDTDLLVEERYTKFWKAGDNLVVGGCLILKGENGHEFEKKTDATKVIGMYMG